MAARLDGPSADVREAGLWAASLAVVLVLHGLVLAALLAQPPVARDGGETLPAVTFDVAPPPAAPVFEATTVPPSQASPEAATPNPVADAPAGVPPPDSLAPVAKPVVTAELAPPEAQAETRPLEEVLKPTSEPQPLASAESPPDLSPPLPQEEALKPTPVIQETAVIALPPPPKPAPAAAPARPKPREKAVERTPPKPVEAKRAERRESRNPPAQRSGAQTTASIPTPSSGAASAASRATWQSALVAHLRRNLRPQGVETGSAAVRFAVDRSGRVLSASLAGSAGSASLDAEALAVFRRSQPLPAPPADVPGASFTFTIPIRFTSR